MTRLRLALVGAVLLFAACVERLTAPGQCPDFCPSGRITIVDTLLTSSINRDSSYRGYVLAYQAPLMLAAHLPGATDTLDGRPIFRINGYGSRFRISTADTSTGPILGADSARLQVYVVRRDTATHNLRLRLYRLPITIDTAGGNTILMIRSSSMIMFDGFPSLRVAREDEDRRIVGFVVGFKTPTWSKCGLPGPERHPFQPTPGHSQTAQMRGIRSGVGLKRPGLQSSSSSARETMHGLIRKLRACGGGRDRWPLVSYPPRRGCRLSSMPPDHCSRRTGTE